MKLDNEQQRQAILNILEMYVRYITGEPKPTLNAQGMMQIGVMVSQLEAIVKNAEIEEKEDDGKAVRS